MKTIKSKTNKKIWLTSGEVQTERIAGELIKEILSNKDDDKSLVIALVGNLGAGKTAFTRGCAKFLGIKNVTSPTFLIFRPYRIPKKWRPIETLYHVDCYRIHKIEEMETLRFKEILNNPKNIVIIEWADRIKKILPKGTKWITIQHGKIESERKLVMK